LLLLLRLLECGVGEPTLDDAWEEDSDDSDDKEDDGEGYLSEVGVGGVGGVGEREKSVSGELGLASSQCQREVETEAAAATGAVLSSRAAMENMMRKERATHGAWHT
jgi:hypothetical protein